MENMKKLLLGLLMVFSVHSFCAAMDYSEGAEEEKSGEQVGGEWDNDNPIDEILPKFSRVTMMGTTPVKSTAVLWGVGLPTIFAVGYPLYKKLSKQKISFKGFKEDTKLFLSVCKALLTPWKKESRTLIKKT
jgi:hypothetical protein